MFPTSEKLTMPVQTELLFRVEARAPAIQRKFRRQFETPALEERGI